MSSISVVGFYVFCKNCSKRFQLGPFNAREIGASKSGELQPYAMGWLCKCVCCGNESTYQREDMVSG
jgi:hypothetical protein